MYETVLEMARNKITFPICMDTAFGVPFTPISYIESYCSVGWRCHDNSSPTLFFPLIRFVTKPTLTAPLHLKMTPHRKIQLKQ